MPPSHPTSPTTPFSRRLNQWICGVHGHETQLQIGADRLLLQCTKCGYVSPGWVVEPAARTAPRDLSRESADGMSARAPASAQ